MKSSRFVRPSIRNATRRFSAKKKKLSHAGKQDQKRQLPVVKCEASDSEVDIKQEASDSEQFSVDTKKSTDSLCVVMPECINDGTLMMRSLESGGSAHGWGQGRLRVLGHVVMGRVSRGRVAHFHSLIPFIHSNSLSIICVGFIY